MPAKTIFFSVGEPSGDLHGANLIRELTSRAAEPLRFVGYGGPRMAAAGAELHTDLTRHAVMGFAKVVGKLPTFLRLAREADRWLRTHRPDAVVLIDFPGFNWHIARAAKKHGVPVFFYGTPQLWAWASWRVKKLRRDVDHALCKLPFEEAWLRERGCNATYVGHPYFDELAGRTLDASFVRQQRAAPGPLVTLLPGSRTQEVRTNFVRQLAVARRLSETHPATRFAVAAFKESHAEHARRAIAAAGLSPSATPTVHVGRTPELIEAATCCLAVSGSVSLELLYHQKPSVILYHISPAMDWVQERFRRVRYITLVNLLTAAELFPDPVGRYEAGDPRDAHVLMPEHLTSVERTEEVAGQLGRWLADPAAYAELVGRMGELRRQVAAGGASARTADYVLRELGVGRAAGAPEAAAA